MDGIRATALVLATMTTGLIAGLFYAYSCSVMIALRRADNSTFIDVMQKINVAIQNGWFALSFIGAALFTGISLFLEVKADSSPSLPFVAAALVVYVVSMGITFRGNIPLNNQLAAAGPVAQIADPAAVRTRFEGPWNRLHLIRTLANTASFLLLCLALLAPSW